MTTNFPNESHEEPMPSTSDRIRRFGLPVLAVAGAVTLGSFLAPVGFASAQENDADTSESDADTSDADTDTDSEGHRHSGKRRGSLALGGMRALGDAVTETLGVTTDDLRQAMSDGKSLADVAEEQGVAVEDLTAALTAAADERLESAVTEGKIDDEQAAEASAGLADRIDDIVNASADDMGRGFRKAHKAAHESSQRRSDRADELADFLGVTADELRQSMTDGQTLAELAEAQGIAESDLVAFLLDGIEERVDAAVAEGKIDADEAAEKLADIEERIEERITAEPGERSGRLGHHKNGNHRDRNHGETSDTQSNKSDTSESLEAA